MTNFGIKGTNTFSTAAAIEIVSLSNAQISVSGSPVILTAGSSTTGTLVVTNDSSSVTATNVQASLSSEVSASVTQDASNCTSLPPGQTCNLVFTPTSTPLALTTISIFGTNTSVASANIAVNSSTQAQIMVTTTLPLTLKADGITTGSMTITNTSSIAATGVTADFSNSALDGNVTVTASTCDSIPANGSCTLTFTPGTNTVVPTSFPIYGSNTTVTTGAIAISPYYVYATSSTNLSTSLIVRCNVSITDGTLSDCITIYPFGSSSYLPLGLTFNSSGTYAYIPTSGPASINICPVSASGDISTCSRFALSGGDTDSANGVSYNPKLNLIYITLSSGTIWKCTLNTTGSAISLCTEQTQTSGITAPMGIALNPQANIAYIANYINSSSSIVQCSVDSTNGDLSSCTANSNTGAYSNGIVIDPQNANAYYTLQASSQVVWATVASNGGALTEIGSLTYSGNTTGLALNGTMNYLYVGSQSNSLLLLCTVNSGSISGCINSGATLLNNPYGVALYPNPP